MKRTALAVLPLLALPLTACGGGDSKATETKTVTTTPSSSTTSTSLATPYGNDPSFAISDTQFLAKMRADVGDKGSDDQLRGIGAQVCKDLRDVGTSVEDEIRALYGTSGYTDDQISFLVATSARAYCPTSGIEQQIRALTK